MEPVETFAARDHAIFVRRFELVVVDGVDRGARVVSEEDEVTIGTAAGTGLRLTDPAVSRHHCAVRACERGLELRDLSSTNGTFLGDHEIVRGFIRSGTRVRIGATTIAVTVLDDNIEHPLAEEDRFGGLLGKSSSMRRLYPLLAKCAASDVTVLIQGETGTGKELVAEAIHAASTRQHGPLVTVDCSALPRQLAESELFGHVRGAFTGADVDRSGAFEDASGGTIFLDEIGELPLDLQPLLLRALENHTIRRVGSNQQRHVDVRVIAASNRDLRVEVNAKRFRADLLYRLNVVRVVVPPLRDREGDIAMLAEHFWRRFQPEQAVPPALLDELVIQAWPGNVRELRNAVERSAIVGTTNIPDIAGLSHAQAKDSAIRQWERSWVERLLAAHGQNVTHAARAAQMGRSHLRRLLQQYGIVRGIPDDEDD
ncbi:MAG: sigma 54-interacting transcriptional regulator [Myxococcota bacterium]|nr:sigma 54-interacting transcriptional regulator [Myxococcota bacterium]